MNNITIVFAKQDGKYFMRLHQDDKMHGVEVSEVFFIAAVREFGEPQPDEGVTFTGDTLANE